MVNTTRASIVVGVVAAAAALLSLATPVLAEEGKPLTMQNLLDRIQIEDLLTRYYYDLSMGKAHELSEYFTADAVLDVDGTIARGHKEIARLYQRPEGAPAPEPTAQRRRGRLARAVNEQVPTTLTRADSARRRRSSSHSGK